MTEISDSAPGPDFNPWRSVWRRPRATLRHILAVNPYRHVLLLAALAGVHQIADEFRSNGQGEEMALPALLGLILVGGAAAGVLGLYIWSALIWLTGRWLGGAAPAFKLRCVVAWSGVPVIGALILILLQLAIFGPDLFSGDVLPDGAGVGRSSLYFLFRLAEAVLMIWSLVILSHGVAEAQGYGSAWKGFGNTLLAGALVIVPIMVLALLAAALSGG